MAKKIIRLTESQLRNTIKEAIHNLMEYNDSFMDRVARCNFLSDEDKKKVQVASMNNWDRHEREARKKKEMKDMEAYANPNIEDKHFGYVGEQKRINEAFKSNQLRQWFKQHGGVAKYYSDGKTKINQDGLGDVSDDMIIYSEEFDNMNDAINKARQLNTPTFSRGRRTDFGMQAYITVYQANDGMCLLVGIDRNEIKTGMTWGGEKTKKSADRYWNRELHDDGSKQYNYSQKGRDFGIYNNHSFQGKKKDNQNRKSQMTDSEWNEYMKNRTADMRDYINKHYPKH